MALWWSTLLSDQAVTDIEERKRGTPFWTFVQTQQFIIRCTQIALQFPPQISFILSSFEII